MLQEIYSGYGNKLKVYRAMYDLTQEMLAKKLQVTRQTIISIEKGQYDPSLQLAFKIANLFSVKTEDAFISEENKELEKIL